jgi:hypothetical protein
MGAFFCLLERIFRVWALYQGTTSVVPLTSSHDEGFSPCTQPLQGLKPCRAGGRLRHDFSRALIQSPDTKLTLQPTSPGL